MKKVYIIFLFSLLFSCNEDLLDVKNEDDYEASTFFKDAKAYEQASTAMYTPLLHGGMFSRDFYFIFDLLGNDAEKNTPLAGSLLEFPNYTHTPANNDIFNLWSACYKISQRGLLVIDAMDKWETEKPEEIELRSRLRGEALFMRSLAHFWLVTLWGDVPIRESFENLDIHMSRRPASEVWQIIENDLRAAIELLPVAYPPADLGRATRGAAVALLGKSYLFQKKYNEAIDQFTKLTTAPYEYELDPEYDHLFNYAKVDSKESIFAVMHGEFAGWGVGDAYYMFGGSETWGRRTTHTGRAMEYGFNGGDWYNVVVSKSLAESFKYTDEGGNPYTDPRAEYVFYGPAGSGGDTEFCDRCADGAKPYTNPNYSWRKYQYYEFEAIHGEPHSGINSQIIRYADVLLMLAESYIETNQVGLALPLINMVRDRSGAFAFTTLGDQNQARQILRKERQMELAGEQIRFFDLVRWGTLVETVNAEKQAANGSAPVKEYHVKLPIPQNERDANPKIAEQISNNWN